MRSTLFVAAVPEDLALAFDGGSRNQLIAEKIQVDLKKAWGIDATLKARDWKSHLQALYRGDVGMFRFGWLSVILDAYAHLSLFRSDSPNNHTGWKNQEYDALLDKIATKPEGPVRQRLIERAAALIDEEAVALPLFHYKMTVALSPRAKGLRVNPLGLLDLSGVK